MTKTAVAAPAPRPSDEEMLEAIARLALRDLARVIAGLRRLLLTNVS